MGRPACAARIAIRNQHRHRIEALKKSPKQDNITGHDLKHAGKIQHKTDGYLKQIDTLPARKENEILAV